MKHISIHILLVSLISITDTITVSAQIVTSLETNMLPNYEAQNIVSTVESDTLQSQFMDWSTTLGEFSRTVNRAEEEELERKIKEADKTSGPNHSTTSHFDENGTDIYLLTDEGIETCMSIYSTCYSQVPTPDVKKWIRYYAYHKRIWTKKIFARYKEWEPRIKECFRILDIPEEIAELCLVESGCSNNAVSKAGAVGMWQIMENTGREYGLEINLLHDDRKDPVKATITAARFLKKSHQQLQEWNIAIAAYNCGIARVKNSIRKNRSNQWDEIKETLPAETQQYLPSLIALHYIWTYRERLGLVTK